VHLLSRSRGLFIIAARELAGATALAVAAAVITRHGRRQRSVMLFLGIFEEGDDDPGI
jgi:hypothetical protein